MEALNLVGWIAFIGAILATLVNIGRLEEYFWKRRERRKEQDEKLIEEAKKEIIHNLPEETVFIGREKSKLELYEALSSGFPFISIEGIGGIGKTALARSLAWELVDGTIPDDQAVSLPNFESIIWAEDEGKGTLVLDELLDILTKTLNYPGITQLPIDDKLNETKRLLKELPTLLVVDNFETIKDSEIEEFITAIPWPPSKVIITSREKKIRTVKPVYLDRMEYEDAKQLISNLDVIELESEEEVKAFYEATGGNPYAFRLAGSLIPEQGLENVLELLSTGRAEGIFDYIYKQNWEVSLNNLENAKDILFAMTFFAATAPPDGVEDVSNVRHAFFREAVERLDILSLIETRHKRDRTEEGYQLHTLTRAFVKNKLESNQEKIAIFQRRFADYYYRKTDLWSDTWINTDNIERQESEKENLIEAAALAYNLALDSKEGSPIDEDWQRVVGFAENMYSFLWGRGYWNESQILFERAVEGARILGDKFAEARMISRIGRIHVWRGSYDEATLKLGQLKEAMNGVNDPQVLIYPKRLEAQLATQLGDNKLAEELLTEVLTHAPDTADDDGRAATLIELGTVAIGAGDFSTAGSRFRSALELDEQSKTKEGQAVSLSFLALSVFELGNFTEARDYFEASLTLAVEVGRLITIADCQLGLAKVYSRLGRRSEVVGYASKAYENYERLRIYEKQEEAQGLVNRYKR